MIFSEKRGIPMGPKRASAIAAFLALALGPAILMGQQPRSLADPAYKAEVLKKVADLVESRYVLADKAKGFADAISGQERVRRLCRSDRAQGVRAPGSRAISSRSPATSICTSG